MMAISRDHIIFFLGSVLLTLACVEAVNARYHSLDHNNNAVSACPHGKYYDLQLKACQKCSWCAVNEIVRRPCHKFRDTVCGPFIEFKKFNTGSSDEETGADQGEPESKNSITNKIHHADGMKQSAEEAKPKHSKKNVKQGTTGKSKARQHKESGLASVTADADQQWRLLALVLIGVLSVVSFLLVVFVVIACHMLKRRRLMDKTVICSSDAQPSGHYFRPPVFTGGRLNPTDHMRALLTVDSETRNPSQRKKDLVRVYNDNASSCLSNVPAYSDAVAEQGEDAADSLVASSNQSVCGDQSSGYSSSSGFPEVIPGPSQDYVYFKAPVRHSFGQV